MNSEDVNLNPSPCVVPGDRIDGKYVVVRIIGQGGMGVVVSARHVDLDELVAIKLLLPGALTNPEAVTRFFREAKAAAKLKSPHAARIHDVGRLASGLPYLVMEHLEGKDLSNWVGQTGPLPIELAIEFLLQAGEAIAEAHSLGIIHRDLKPSNLFCANTPDGMPSIRVLDFGISKLVGQDVSNDNPARTNTRAILGSPLYMSPEQLRSARDVDVRTDIWSLGVVLYEVLSGEPPFNGDSFPELIFQIMNREPQSLRTLRPEIPAGLAAVVSRCLAKDVEHRYETVAALAEALLPFAPKRALLSVERISRIARNSQGPKAPAPSDAARSSSHSTLNAWGHSWTVTSRNGKRVLSFCLLGLLTVAAGVLLLVQMRRHHTLEAGPSGDAGLALSGASASPTINTNRADAVPSPDGQRLHGDTPGATNATVKVPISVALPPTPTARKNMRPTPQAPAASSGATPLPPTPQAPAASPRATPLPPTPPKPDPFADPH